MREQLPKFFEKYIVLCTLKVLGIYLLFNFVVVGGMVIYVCKKETGVIPFLSIG
jgi:hypothetical protein